jgi:hypothetical protein
VGGVLRPIFFGFGARCLRSQIWQVWVCNMGCLGFFFKAELGQIWELFWSKKNVHSGFLRWWF